MTRTERERIFRENQIRDKVRSYLEQHPEPLTPYAISRRLGLAQSTVQGAVDALTFIDPRVAEDAAGGVYLKREG
ncbi:MAG: MarR family transcriptional regulator [Treponema sp.]|jgi:DNA-binding transcriptional ArsR family regulator|nr:MarR family transcriptional regulator [Treponema sp.]